MYLDSKRFLHLDLAKTGGSGKVSVSTPNPDFTIDEKAVTDGAEIFSVQCEHTLSEHEYHIHALMREKGITGAMRELGSHFRSAHWRRPPGKGDDPEASKTVKVRWTLVNEKRLPEKASPRGTCTVVG